jgi:hypothetical protein
MNHPCKIGTIPMVIHAIDRRTPFEVGRIVRIKERRGDRWQTVLVTRIDVSGYFMADRI